MHCSRFSVLVIVLAGASALTLPAQTNQAAPAMHVDCRNTLDDHENLVVEPRATMRCTAMMNGRPVTGVEWRVNDMPGGNNLLGTIGADGVYHAPGEGPGRERVNIEAFDLNHKTEATAPVFISKVPEPIKGCVRPPGSGMIALGDGASVQFPPGNLSEDVQIRVQLLYAAVQPTNTLFQGVRPSLLIRFCDRFGKPYSGPVVKSGASSSEQQIIFHVPRGPEFSDRDVSDFLGALDVYDGGDNYYALLPHPGQERPVELAADPTMVADPWFIQVGLTTLIQTTLNQSALVQTFNQYRHSEIGWMQVWNRKTSAFTNEPKGFCPKGSRTMVLVHGMLSAPAGAFDPDDTRENSAQWAAEKYDTVVAFDYKWWLPIDQSAPALTEILNRYSDPACKYRGTFDIEAHSEGTVVVLVGLGSKRLTTDAMKRIQHIVLVAGPLEGTPLADNAPFYLTVLLNVLPPKGWTVLVPEALHELMPFIEQLGTHSSLLSQIRVAASQTLMQKQLVLAAGDRSVISSPEAVAWAWHHALLNAVPNDGVVPVSSALIQTLQLPHMTRLVGNDPKMGDNPYPLNHTSLVNNPAVIRDIEQACDLAVE